MKFEVRLTQLLEKGLVTQVHGDPNCVIRGIKHDSRRVEPGDLFVAIDGVHHQGIDFISDAIQSGASAILAEYPIEAQIPVLATDNALLALSRIATYLYHDPTSHLDVIGVTGTNGKTTTTYLIESMLNRSGMKPAVIGTVDFRGPQGTRAATHTTPMADDLMRIVRESVDAGATHLVLEVSSHALAMHRADGVHFKVAALTNLTQDHLDYHGDLITYERAKRRLFEELQPAVKVLNLDDSLGKSLADELKGNVISCSKREDSKAQVRAVSFTSNRKGIRAVIDTPFGKVNLVSPLIGEHNLDNILLALGCGIALNLNLDQMLEALRDAKGAPGRLERIEHPNQVLTLVDYAHTPDALDRVLHVLRSLTQRRLIVLFGCGGDRDKEKRPLMGRVAARCADLLYLTSDNPRSESPERIIEHIEKGVKEANVPRIEESQTTESTCGYLIQQDRRLAISLAIAAARPGDTVLIAGKGHEKVQIIGDQRNPFDDRSETRCAIEKIYGKR